ncbi:MAG TPA: hypothetical protein VGD61_25820 [Pyrinomonadaceae bacterium]
MKSKLTAILALTVVLLCPHVNRSQQPQQPIKHFGYLTVTTDADLSRVRSYTDFTYLDGDYSQSIYNTATRVRNNGMRVVVDLGKVFWCPDTANPFGSWHLCGYSEVDFMTRWNNWTAMNASVLNSDYVLAFSVITEPSLRGISSLEVEYVINLVKQRYPQIPTMVAESYISVDQPSFQVPRNSDWVGVAAYYIHPNLDYAFKESVRLLKLKKQSWQRLVYTLDGFHGFPHDQAGILLNDMDTIAQEWYTYVSNDPEAILVGVFSWLDVPDVSGTGSKNLPQHVLDKHVAIGSAIFAGRTPGYQGFFETINCQSLGGWAWDSSEPNTPISVDVYEGVQRSFHKIATVRANQFRSDLVTAGIGNGQHGFTFNLPAILHDGQSHLITIDYSGLDQQLSLSPQTITCSP